MADIFKLNSGVKLETSKTALKACEISQKYKTLSKGINKGFSALDAYVKEENDIKKLLQSYVLLVKKDMNDIDKMVDEAMLADLLRKNSFMCSIGRQSAYSGGGSRFPRGGSSTSHSGGGSSW